MRRQLPSSTDYPVHMSEVDGRPVDRVWRPGRGTLITYLFLAAALSMATAWLASDDALTASETVMYGSVSAAFVLLTPVVLLRWRIVIADHDLLLVFLRVRRIPLREIVGAKGVAREGLVFVCRDGSEHSFQGLGNSAWGHRRRRPTHSDLVARDVLAAASMARGEDAQLDFRLPPVQGGKQAALQAGIVAAVIGIFSRD